MLPLYGGIKVKKDFRHSSGHQWSSSHTCPRSHLKQIHTFKKLLRFFKQKQNFIPIILLIYSRVVCNKMVTYFYLSYNYLLSFIKKYSIFALTAHSLKLSSQLFSKAESQIMHCSG